MGAPEKSGTLLLLPMREVVVAPGVGVACTIRRARSGS
jgi:hypothetical protein